MREFLVWFSAVGGVFLLALILIGLFGNDPAGWLAMVSERLSARWWALWQRLTTRRFKPVKEESNG